MDNNEAHVCQTEVMSECDESYALVQANTQNESEGLKAIHHAVTKMELKWEQEKAEHARWKKEDITMQGYLRIVAMMASAALGEGSLGTRPRAGQIVEIAREYADAIFADLDKNPPAWVTKA